MRDDPPAREILTAAIEHLRDVVLPAISGRPAFDLRVALSALDLVWRELASPPEGDAVELAALRTLLDAEGDLDSLNRLLAERIAAGRIAADDPALLAHLHRTTLAKLAVDQPNYASYRRHLPSETAP